MDDDHDHEGPPAPRPLAGRTVAVFGSSEPPPGSAAYEEARAVGGLLAARGARVASGGYGGVMEGASRGARDAGGETLGVTCRQFASRVPNPWISEAREGADLFERTRLLIDLSDAFIILPGKSGTLAELTFLWALDRAGLLGAKPVVLCGEPWDGLIAALDRAGALETAQRRITAMARTPARAVEEVIRRFAQPDGAGAPPDRETTT